MKNPSNSEDRSLPKSQRPAGPLDALKAWGVRLGVLIFTLATFCGSLPRGTPGSPIWYDRLLDLVWASGGQRGFDAMEWMGLHNRWNMFAHSPGDSAHKWYNIDYAIEVTDAIGVRQNWTFPLDPSTPFWRRYLDYRFVRFKNSFWITKGAFLLPVQYSFARRFLQEHPQAQFPIKVSILSEFEEIMAPEITAKSPVYRNPFGELIVTQADLSRCTDPLSPSGIIPL